MAQTDAISVACKNLGFASDIYYGLDDTKYRAGQDDFAWGRNVPTPPPAPGMQAPAPQPQPQPQPQYQPTPASAPQPQSQATPAVAAPAPAPAASAPANAGQPGTITLEQAISLATNAQSADELYRIWNDFKKIYGSSTEFKKAISSNPNNPSRKG